MAVNQNITQITNQQAVYDPTTIIYGVPISTGLDSTFTGQVFRTWLFANPIFTGTAVIPTVTISGGTIDNTILGGTTPVAGHFTTLSATSTVSGAGFTTLLAPYLTTASAAATYAPIASPTFTGTVVIPTVTLSGGTINGTSVGATTPSTGAFTTLSASSTVSGTGFSTYLASPPSIGSTAAGSGAFTTLSASSTVSGTGFSTYLASPPAIGGTAAAAGSFTTLSSTGNFTPSQTNGIVGTTTNNNANAGSIGEHVTATGTGVSVTTATPTNITSISLTAGDWEVSGSIAFIPAGSTVPSVFIAGTNNTSATLAAAPLNTVSQLSSFPAGLSQAFPIPSQRYSLSATTTIFLIGQSTFTTSTMTATATIRARRVR